MQEHNADNNSNNDDSHQPQPTPQPTHAPQPGYALLPGYAQQPMPQQMGPPVQLAENPGHTLGIVGLVLNFFGINIGGIILGVMSRNKSRQVGMSPTMGTVSLVWGIIGTVIGFLLVIFFIFLMFVGALASTSTSSSSSYSDYSSEQGF